MNKQFSNSWSQFFGGEEGNNPKFQKLIEQYQLSTIDLKQNKTIPPYAPPKKLVISVTLSMLKIVLFKWQKDLTDICIRHYVRCYCSEKVDNYEIGTHDACFESSLYCVCFNSV